jgi:hypothetical protein
MITCMLKICGFQGIMSNEQSPICPNCSAWMLNHPTNPEYLKCVSCGCCVKVNKRVIKPVGDKRAPRSR